MPARLDQGGHSQVIVNVRDDDPAASFQKPENFRGREVRGGEVLEDVARECEIEILVWQIRVEDRCLNDLEPVSEIPPEAVAGDSAHVRVELDRSNRAMRQGFEQPFGDETRSAADLEDRHAIPQAEVCQGGRFFRPAQIDLSTQTVDICVQPG